MNSEEKSYEDVFEGIEEQPKKPPALQVAHSVVALSVIAGLIYLSGIHQYFFYKRTPSATPQENIESVIDADMLIVPLTVFILTNDESNGSRRSDEDAIRLVENASRIWNQASIALQVKNLYVYEESDRELNLFYNFPEVFVRSIDDFDPRTINVFLVGRLGGINGIAFVGIRSVAVSDVTTVYDFRALAHEVGHALGLNHIPGDKNRLMYRGANGFELALEEIIRSREVAEEIFVQ